MTKYDTRSLLGTEQWLTSAISDHAYAHPMDGYRLGAVMTSTDASGSVSFDRPETQGSDLAVLTNATRSQ